MKSISKILVVAMVVSMFASFSGFAVDHVAQDLINTMTEGKIWTDGCSADKCRYCRLRYACTF